MLSRLLPSIRKRPSGLRGPAGQLRFEELQPRILLASDLLPGSADVFYTLEQRVTDLAPIDDGAGGTIAPDVVDVVKLSNHGGIYVHEIIFFGGLNDLQPSEEGGIDAFAIDDNGDYLISIRDDFFAGEVTGTDEDLFLFSNTGKNWKKVFDGSNFGLSEQEGLDAVSFHPDGRIIFSVNADDTTVGDLTGIDDSDLVAMTPTYDQDGTIVAASFELFWDARSDGFGSGGGDLEHEDVESAFVVSDSLFFVTVEEKYNVDRDADANDLIQIDRIGAPRVSVVLDGDMVGLANREIEALHFAMPQSNLPPVVESVANVNATVGENVTVDVNASDPEGQSVTFQLASGPSGATIHPVTGLFTWTPSTSGMVGVVVIVHDADGESTSVSFDVHVAPGGGPPSPPPGSVGDFVVWRPQDGTWHVRHADGTQSAVPWGLSYDVPVYGDYDGDGTRDYAVWREAGGVGYWYINYANGGTHVEVFGQAGDIPVVGNFDDVSGDELAVYRPSDQTWWSRAPQTNRWTSTGQQFGLAGDIPVPADYDGDGRTDLGVYRPADGTWWAMDAQNFGRWIVLGERAGIQHDIADWAVPGDYSGDGVADLAVWNSTTGVWKYRDSMSRNHVQQQWGLPGDYPQPNDYDHDGITDMAVYRPGEGNWYVRKSTGGFHVQQWGLPDYLTSQDDWAVYDTTRHARRMIQGLPQTSMGAAELRDAPVESLEAADIEPLLERAVEQWGELPHIKPLQSALSQVNVHVADLPEGRLGSAYGSDIVLDVNADGHGWFVDATPGADSEFSFQTRHTLHAIAGPVADRIDALTVLMHELGHVLGYEDLDADRYPNHIMADRLPAGVRRTVSWPNPSSRDQLFSALFQSERKSRHSVLRTAWPGIDEPANDVSTMADAQPAAPRPPQSRVPTNPQRRTPHSVDSIDAVLAGLDDWKLAYAALAAEWNLVANPDSNTSTTYA